MEQVQQKRGLRIVAAIMFILLCVLMSASRVRYIVNEMDYMGVHGKFVAQFVIQNIVGLLIVGLLMYVMIVTGLLSKKKSNALRFTMGGLCVAVLAADIIFMLIQKYALKYILRNYWMDYVTLLAAAACLFAVKKISVAGVGFSMLALREVRTVLEYTRGDVRDDVLSIVIALLFLIVCVLAALVCFLNDSDKIRSAAKPLGIVGIVFLGLWWLVEQGSMAMYIDDMGSGTDEILMLLRNEASILFLFLGILFALIAIAFRKKPKAQRTPQYQQYTPQYVPYPPQYQPYAPQYAPQGQQQYAPQYAQQYAPQGQQPYAPQAQQPTRQPEPPKEEKPWFCTLCGTQNEASSRFCQNCGTQNPDLEQTTEETTSAQASTDPRILNWEQYAPLEAGVSMKPGKDYKFHRADGFVGSLPQKFVDRTFVKCPICCSANPNWTISQHNQMSWKGNLYLFKCSCCGSVISMSMPDVTTLGNGGGGVALNPSVGLTNLMVKASSGKEAGAVYAVIESVGNSGVTPACEGKEFKLEQLQQMSLRA